MKIIIFSVGNNCEEYIKKHTLSVLKQNIKSLTKVDVFHVIVDDGSTDKTSDLLVEYLQKDKFIYLHRNETEIGWLASAAKYLDQYVSNPGDIIVILDLYDWFASQSSLSIIYETYYNNLCWMTYGGFAHNDFDGRHVSQTQPFNKNTMELRSYRSLDDDSWKIWRPITFRSFLWLNIDHKDLKINDKFIEGPYDKILALPLLESIPKDKIIFIEDVLYILNKNNKYHPINNKYNDESFKHLPTYTILPENYLDRLYYELHASSMTPDSYRKITKQLTNTATNQFFIIFSCGYNCEKYIYQNMQRVANQTYKNYIHIIVDDASTDKTLHEIERYKDDKTIIIRNKNNYKWLRNSIEHLKPRITNPETIIVVLDLDDWFANNTVLEKLNKIYSTEGCWVTYGSCKRQDTGLIEPNPSHSREYTSIRVAWYYTHLKTFKAFLFDRINPIDFKDRSGNWLQYSYDRFLMYPILEMTPKKRIRFIKDILVTYNTDNPLSVFKTNSAAQKKMKEYSKAKRRYTVYER